jgi:DNA ligase-1
MRAFADLYDALDATNSTNEKVALIASFLRGSEPADAAWAVAFLSGQRLTRLVSSAALRRWAMEESGVAEWLFDECRAEVGDSAETIALLLGRMRTGVAEDHYAGATLAEWMESRILPLRGLEESEQRARVIAWWRSLDARGVYALCKMLTGALRVGVSRTLVVRAVAEVAGLETARVEARLMGDWSPTAAGYARLIAGVGAADAAVDAVPAPWPFYLASPVPNDLSEGDVSWFEQTLGPVEAWAAEWKWDGIRGQLLRRGGGLVALWSRGEEVVTERFPEIAGAAARLPEGVALDGEILGWDHEAKRPLGFQALQTRIGRKVLSAKVLRDCPVVFVAYDLLEEGGTDVRSDPWTTRRARLERTLAGLREDSVLRVSEVLTPHSWVELSQCRSCSRGRGVEGLMLKHRDSAYGVGRRVGSWWKWKIEPMSVDAVLMYAQPGSGRRANLLTDYTFGVWDRGGESEQGKLVPFAKAYSGLTNEEIAEVDAWIRGHTVERFGPVRVVESGLVFEIGFEGIAASGRHQSGVAVRFPRILRRRLDKPAVEADTLGTLRGMIGERK